MKEALQEEAASWPVTGNAPPPVSEFAVLRRRARAEAAWRNCTFLSAVLAALYLVLAVTHYFYLDAAIRMSMVGIASFSALLSAALFVYLYRSPVRIHWAHPVAFLCAAIVLANSAFHLYLTARPDETSNFILLAIGCGLLYCSTPLLIGTLSLALGIWLMIAYAAGTGESWTNQGFFFVQSTLIAWLAHSLRIRSLDRILAAEVSNEKQRHELLSTVAELAQAEERLRKISEATFEAVFLHRAGRIVDVNEQALRMFGYSREEFQRMDMTSLLAPEARAESPLRRKTLHSFAGANRDGGIHESVGLHKDGHRFPVEFGAVRQSYGSDQVDAAVVRDISSRHRLEQRLLDFVEKAADFIFEMDLGGHFLYVNTVTKRLYGSDPIGQSFFQFVHPDHRERVKAEIARREDWTSKTLYQEYRIAAEGKRERWLGHNVQAMMVQGEPVGFRVLARDVTERVMAVRQAVAARLEAEEANRSKSRFLSSMSHELRTPLNGIFGFSQLLQEEIHGALNPRQQEYVTNLTECSTHLMTLIEDLLDLSKADIDAIDLQIIPIPVSPMVQSAAATIRQTAEDKDLTVILDLTEGGSVKADPRRFRQILLNLLSNAVKYSPPNAEMKIRSRLVNGNRLEISVEDQGPGVPAEHRADIFNEFYQADHVRDANLGGSGIGLALVKKLIVLHGGEVGYRDRPGGGSIFWFTLEAAAEEPRVFETTDAPPRQVSPGSGSGRILVVDDIETNLYLVTEALTARGHAVDTARNGAEAVERAVAFRPDLILMDMRMPVMDGMQATTKLKAMPEFEQTPIVALTASASNDAVADCLRAGCVEHLGKPVQFTELFACIDRNLVAVRDGRGSITEPPKRALRVLIADDSDINRSVMSEFFLRFPDDAHCVSNGREAVEAALGEPFDLIFMDIQMPEMNGLEATREIRRHKDSQELPIVGLSGMDARDNVDACLSAGMNEFLTKPVRLSRLIEILDTYRIGVPASQFGGT